MKSVLFSLFLLALLFSVESEAIAQRRSSSTRSTTSISTPKPRSYGAPKKQTYDLGGTKYITGETYKSTGAPKVDRSSSAKKDFLNSRGYQKAPAGYDVDHIIPLSKEGADKPYNMQLLPRETHKQKTASERKKK